MDLATVGGIDVAAGRSGIAKDMRILADEGVFGWAVLIVVFALPVVSVLLLAGRRWLALLPLAISFAVLATWFLYYAAEWWSNPGQGAWLPAVAIVLFGWFIVAVELLRMRRPL